MPIDKYSGSFTTESLQGDISLKSLSGKVSLIGPTGIDLTSDEGGTGVLLSTDRGANKVWLKQSGDFQISADDIAISSDNTYWTSSSTTNDCWRFKYPDKSDFASGKAVFRVASQDQDAAGEGDLVVWSNGMVSMPHLEITSSLSVNTSPDISFETSNDFEVNAGNKVYIESGPANGSDDHDITLEAGDDINLKASDKIKLEASDNITLEAFGKIKLEADDSVEVLNCVLKTVDQTVTGNITIEGKQNDGVTDNALYVKRIISRTGSGPIFISNDNDGGPSSQAYVMVIENESGDETADGVKIVLNGDSEAPDHQKAGHANNWLNFFWGFQSVGAIQGASPNAQGVAFYQVANAGVGNVSMPWNITQAGNAQFASGNADFGEFFEIGNKEEWPEYQEFVIKGDKGIYGLPEGLVVWAIGEKFYKKPQDGVGVPLFITKRALIVGSAKALMKESDEKKVGEILSFSGKLPVIVKGAVGIGDYLVPISGENICRGIPQDLATFEDYKHALGTALESCEENTLVPAELENELGEFTDIHEILCAVGVK